MRLKRFWYAVIPLHFTQKDLCLPTILMIKGRFISCDCMCEWEGERKREKES